jgi:hypothetical protein
MATVICDKPYSSSDKWTASFMLGILFLLVSSPFAYSLTNSIAKGAGFVMADSQGCPNLAGMILHTILFILLLRLMLNKDHANDCLRPYTSRDKWTVSIIGGLLFILVSSPFLYELVNSLTTSLNIDITMVKGCPNIKGLVLHTVIFVVVARLLIR